ncbi:RNase HII [Tistlia consotensis]|uniref:Ribonuclease HII n=1 Tax=Tistlia consotensis USBA 355 TaxID=560819 RepID=A0A1Y6C687_9PROT|nr:ribonuclease HII [Tistlia consotensis]SMF39097.1 RNase HII [Tistlia consotensis USBA 355]SNR36549.1 RNase HII [Tistlia consotensis]
MPPDYSEELRLGAAGGRRIAGLDEAGRGPLAGPVFAAAVCLRLDALPSDLRDGLDDSKKLTAEKRERIAELLPRYAETAVARAEVEEIDRINILQASLLAMRRAAEALGSPPDVALIDGNKAPALACRCETLVGGDGRSFSIAAASILAKVARDAEMLRLALEHPGYGWERNKGYGTAEHLAGLQRLGPCLHHRRSFAPIRLLLVGETAATPCI